MSCLFVGKYTEGLLRPLASTLLPPFTNRKDYCGRIFVAPTTGLIRTIIMIVIMIMIMMIMILITIMMIMIIMVIMIILITILI